MKEFRIYVVRKDQRREEQPDRFTSAKAAFEAAFTLADRLATSMATEDASAARFVDVCEGDKLCIGIGVGHGPHTSR